MGRRPDTTHFQKALQETTAKTWPSAVPRLVRIVRQAIAFCCEKQQLQEAYF